MSKEQTTAIATYGEWTPEQMEKESSEMSSGGDFWKAPVGKTSLRFLPPKIGWKSPFVIQHQHFVRLPGLSNPVIFCCPRMHEQAKCMVCLRADQLETSGNKRDADMAKTLRPQRRMLANVVVNPGHDSAKLVIWTFGTKVYGQLKAIREDDEGGGNFLDPVKGFNIVVQRKGTGKDDTTYTLIPSRSITALANMDWIEMQHDLRKLVRIPTLDQQKRLLDGDDPRDVWGEARQRDRERRDEEAIDADGEETRTAEDDLFDDEVELD